jgi:hypothetical protein
MLSTLRSQCNIKLQKLLETQQHWSQSPSYIPIRLSILANNDSGRGF